MKTRMNASRVFLLTFCLLMMSSPDVAAATDYGFSVAGITVTSDNCRNIPHVSGVFDSGTASYDPTSNTLTLTNCTIAMTGTDKRAIHNKSCWLLKVKLVGSNNLSSQNASAVRFENDGTLEVVSGTTTISSVNYEGIYVYFGSLDIKGPGNLYVESTNDCAIEGHSNDNCLIYFYSGLSATIQGKKGDLVDLTCYFSEDSNTEVKLKATNNSSYPNVKNTYFKKVINSNHTELMTPGKSPVIIEPIGATMKALDGEHIDYMNVYYNGSQVYSQDVIISTRWKVLFLPDFFPDTNFRSYLCQLFGKGYMTESEVAAFSKLDISGRNIELLTGIENFRALRTLDCSNNIIKRGPFLYHESLTNLNCSNNQLSALWFANSLTTLDCSNNQLTETRMSSIANLQSLKCGKNDFPVLDIRGNQNLSTLDCSNCTKLTSLLCSNNTALTSLNASGCSQLTGFDCGNESLTSLNVSGCSQLTTLICYNNALTSLNVSGCSQLTNLDCRNNNLTSLSVTGLTNLKTLQCDKNASLYSIAFSNNVKLSTLSCTECALKSLNCSNMSSLQQLLCYKNQLNSLSLSGCSQLSELNCYSNRFTTLSIKNFKNLKTLNCNYNSLLENLDCSNNGLTNLYITDNTSLKYLTCSNNKLTSLETASCRNLKSIQCDGNQFTTLSISIMSLNTLNCSNNTLLTELKCHSNHMLGELNVDGCTALQTLECNGNNLNTLDISDCTDLSSLNCSNNSLTGLDVSYNRKLKYLNCNQNSINGILDLSSLNQGTLLDVDCSDNRITGIIFSNNISYLRSLDCSTNCITDMDGIVSKLPDRNGMLSGTLRVIRPAQANEQNVITVSQVQAARSNNWDTYQLVNGSWILYDGSHGIVTGMEPAVSSSYEDAPLYNLSGQRVDKNYKGVVIRNNKKVRMK